jgi:hypothetical protein
MIPVEIHVQSIFKWETNSLRSSLPPTLFLSHRKTYPLRSDLRSRKNAQPDGKTYTFEGHVSGYYSDPTPPSLRNDRLYKSRCSQTNTQYFYVDVNPRLDRVLANMHASTKVFVNGDYRFPAEESAPGYIEVRNVNFNATNRSTLTGSIANVGASGGANRRNVALKSSPAEPRYNHFRPALGPLGLLPDHQALHIRRVQAPSFKPHRDPL